VLSRLAQAVGRRLARFLTRPLAHYERFDCADPQRLRASLQLADVLLLEGNSRVSSVIKYLTRSTWSHACLYVGRDVCPDIAGPTLLEADMVDGVMLVPLSKYEGFNSRICRPVGLEVSDRQAVVCFALDRVGYQYDLRNIFDLARYLFPVPPIPQAYGRRLMAFGSGDPTQAICSSILARAFQSIRYPILPRRLDEAEQDDEQLLVARHYSHFTPRDFDLSPYFTVVKPTLEHGFDYHAIHWKKRDRSAAATPQARS